MRPFVSVLFLASVSLAAPASGQILVVGESPAAMCFQNAAAGRSDLRALDDCDRALETTSVRRRDRIATFINRGIILMYRGDSEGALVSYDRAEQMGAEEPASLALNRSSALIRLSRFSEAIEQTDIVIALNERNLAEAWLNRGVALEFMGDLEGAYRSYSRALELRPDWPMAQREVSRFTVESSR
ncbi:tetratricopeptide repeat protein [Maricaulis parjimensis]|uniref:tetratricopeptide repeat protein n=1 Tax=Maricaulis parjimensis TaxID=144023 RepID=UPI0019392FF5|nr:tetratricopeptide repeat protein [Maricaulis parjimensis]